MPNVMLPAHSRAVPATNILDVDGPEDEPGEEMAREARVWKTYVRETDRWDREMIDGRSNSLDVMLIFAALFSAISTAFIVESLGDLKPDPAESSAQTLLTVSQTLAAIANGQPVDLPTQGDLDAATFSPSRSAVAVNVLWLLSLSLSVAVSLVAMLAKEWCYKFMSGRSGQIYNQARRRQEKWNGIERWKMEEVLAWLPGAMHLALLLFAAGLCVYLWDINVSVAVPVIVMTASTTCAYMLATILPWIDRFCPYSTPATAVKFALLSLLEYASSLTNWARSLAWQALLRQTVKNHPPWLQSTLGRMRDWLRPRLTSRDLDRSTTEHTKVPMDLVTTQLLAWLIENCDDQRSVDTALQAFAGAYDLPVASLGDMPFDLAKYRLDTCVKPDLISKSLSAEELSQLAVSLRYSRACITLAPDRFRRESGQPDPDFIAGADVKKMQSVVSTHIYLLKLAHQQTSDSGMLAIAATCAAMPICLWRFSMFEPELDVLGQALDSLTPILALHLEKGDTTLSVPTVYRLAESSAYYLVRYWPGERRHGSRDLLPLLLARVVATYYEAAPDTARAAAVTLAATAFACDTHPGGEGPTPGSNARGKRAMGVFRHYQIHKPNWDHVRALLLFGLFGVLPRYIMSGHCTQLTDIARFCDEMTIDPEVFEYVISREIWSMPQSFSLGDHILTCLFKCLSGTRALNHESGQILAELWIAGARGRIDPYPHSKAVNPRTYANAAIALCFAQRNRHKKLFMEIINAQQIPDEPLKQLKSYRDDDLLWQLCRTLLNTRTEISPIAAVHFGLLVASIISSTKDSLYARRLVLRPLLCFHDRFLDLMWPSPFVFGELVSHLEQCITEGSTFDGLGRTMQFVVDFCGTDWSPDMGSSAGSTESTDVVDWRSKLQNLKDRYRPSVPINFEAVGMRFTTPGNAFGAAGRGRNLDSDDQEWAF